MIMRKLPFFDIQIKGTVDGSVSNFVERWARKLREIKNMVIVDMSRGYDWRRVL